MCILPYCIIACKGSHIWLNKAIKGCENSAMKMNGDCDELLKKMSMRCILAVESFANHKTIYNFAPQLSKQGNK